jgi:hypothetical protein
MIVFPRNPLTGDKLYISVTAVNRGNAPTTITHFCGYHTKNLWDLIRRKRQNFVVNTHPGLGKQVPCVLAPGEEWQNMADQENLQESFKGGFLYIGVIHNQRARPVYVRIHLAETAAATA